MDREQQDLVIGRTFRRQREVRDKLDCLVAQAHELGRLFDRIARVLSQANAKEILVCGGESCCGACAKRHYTG